jgi:nicotinate phosphoribosyltransferase
LKNESGKMVNLLDIVLKYRKEIEWTETNEGELAAFIAYGVAFPSSFLCLVDTYSTLKSGVKNFILVALALKECGYVAKGIRLDSGNLAALSISCHEMFKQVAEKYNQNFLAQLDIVVSDGINEEILHELNESGHKINVFGIGTNLVTCQAQPALGCVFKLVQLDGEPKIKLSNTIEKVLIPGQKKSFRLYGKDGFPEFDLLVEINDEVPKAGEEIKCFSPFSKTDSKIFIPSRVKELLHTVWNSNGAAVIPDLMESRKKCRNEIESLNPATLRINKPIHYDIFLSEKLHKDLHTLWESKSTS